MIGVTKIDVVGANIPVIEDAMVKDKGGRLYAMTEERMEGIRALYDEAWRNLLCEDLSEVLDCRMRDAYYKAWDILFEAEFDRLGEETGLSRLPGMRVIRLREGASSYVEKMVGGRRIGELKLSVEFKV